MGKKKNIEVRKETAFSYIFDKHSVFTERKKALMSRDPLTKDLLNKLDSYRPNQSEPSEKEIEIKRQELAKKWNVGIIITAVAKHFVTGVPIIGSQARDNCLSPIKFTYDGINIQEMEPLLIFNNIAGNPVESFASPFARMFTEIKPGTLNLSINLSLLDRNDAQDVKRAVWSIIEKYIPKNKPKAKFVDIPELSFIYDCKPKSFSNYVRWYDLHVNECLGFRVIACLEEHARKGIADVSALIEKLKKKRIPIGTKDSFKGEDRIEKGVKLIYQAIHREKYPARKDRHKTFLDVYDCPQHGSVECPTTCQYFKKWQERFDKVLPPLK